MKIEISGDTMLDAAAASLAKKSNKGWGGQTIMQEAKRWLERNETDLTEEAECLAKEVVRRVMSPRPCVTAPTLDLGRLKLYVYDAGQTCKVADHRSMCFGGDATAGLVYLSANTGHFEARDVNVRDESTWDWIRSWMVKGFKAEGLWDEKEGLGSLSGDKLPRMIAEVIEARGLTATYCPIKGWEVKDPTGLVLTHRPLNQSELECFMAGMDAGTERRIEAAMKEQLRK